MSVALIFPPAVDPRAPHLALPSLAAHLRQHGETVHLFDLNVGGMRYLLEPERLRESARRVRAAPGHGFDPSTAAGRLALHAGKIAASAADALAALADPLRFYDPREFHAARALIVAALELSARAFHPGLGYSIDPARYDIAGVDPQRLDPLIEATARDELNLFGAYWQDRTLPELARLAPELVGVTITNRQQLLPGLMLARRLRRAGHFTVIGGTVFSKFAAELARLPAFFAHFADALVAYEGETALLALLAQRRGGGDLAAVPNLLYARDGRVHATPTHVEDIDALPTPDFAGLDLTAYLAPHPVLPIVTGKGCYFNRCKFCDIPYINHISRKAYRVRAVERIAADVATLAERFACRHFVITDEALSPLLLTKLAAALKRLGLRDLSFTGYARLEPGFTPEVCATLREMGMKKLFFGLESADQATLDHMDKGIRVEAAPRVLANCARAGIAFHVFSIVGFPQEGEASARRTLQFFLDQRELIDAPANSFDIHPFGLELRTDYFRERARYGLEIAPPALAKDFVIGIDRTDWRSADSLTAARIAQLLDEEFHPALRQAYRRHHGRAGGGLWPGFEEYAVLYGGHYAGAPFPFFSATPELAPGQQAEFRWNPALAVMADGERVLLVGGERYLLLERRNYQALADRRVGDYAGELAETLQAPADRPQALRERLDWLIANDFLQLRVVATPDAPCALLPPGVVN